MKPFESFLAKELEEYLAYRRGLGYADQSFRSRLRPLDRQLQTSADRPQSLPPAFFLRMRQELPGRPKTVNNILSTVRGFFDFLVRRGDYPENPLRYIPPRREDGFIPFIFAPDHIERLLQAARMRMRRDHHSFFQDLTVYTALLLLARCGLRISEPLRLKRHHYRSEEKTLLIEKTKFGKQRLIPLPASTAREIDNYLAACRTLRAEDTNPFLLPGKEDRPLSAGRIYSLFYQAVRDIGQAQPRRIVADLVFGAPTPHSLRHSFAVNTLKAAKLRGQAPGRILPVLSVYLGHRKYRYTAVYLKVIDAEQRQGLVNFAVARQEEP